MSNSVREAMLRALEQAKQMDKRDLAELGDYWERGVSFLNKCFNEQVDVAMIPYSYYASHLAAFVPEKILDLLAPDRFSAGGFMFLTVAQTDVIMAWKDKNGIPTNRVKSEPTRHPNLIEQWFIQADQFGPTTGQLLAEVEHHQQRSPENIVESPSSIQSRKFFSKMYRPHR